MWPFRAKRRPPYPDSEPHEPAEPAELPPPEPEPPRTAEDVLRQLGGEPKAPKGEADPGLGRCLLAEGPITSEFLRQQIAVSGKGDTYLGQILAQTPAPEEAELWDLLAAGYRVPQVDLKQCRVPIPVATSIPREIALKYGTVPIDRFGDLLCVVFAGELNPKAIEAIRRATGLRVKALQCPAHHVKILLRRLYHGPVAQEVVAAVPISEREYDEATQGPEARWDSVHATRGPVRARRLARRSSP